MLAFKIPFVKETWYPCDEGGFFDRLQVKISGSEMCDCCLRWRFFAIGLACGIIIAPLLIYPFL